MEVRNYKLQPRKPGGNASKGAVAYKLSLPTKWLKEMGITFDEREVQLVFDGSKIAIHKKESEKD